MGSRMEIASVEQTAVRWDEQLVGEMGATPAAAMVATTDNQTAVEWVANLVQLMGCLGVRRSVE